MSLHLIIGTYHLIINLVSDHLLVYLTMLFTLELCTKTTILNPKAGVFLFFFNKTQQSNFLTTAAYCSFLSNRTK